MFSKLFTTVRELYITCKQPFFQVFSSLIWRNWAKQVLEGFGNSKIEQNKSSFSHSVYVSPKAESCISGLSGWKTKRSFGQAASVISLKDSSISETTKDCVINLIHDWLVFRVLWVSRLRRDRLLVILYIGLSTDSFCKSSSSPFVFLWMSLEEESNAHKRVQRGRKTKGSLIKPHRSSQ